MQHSEATIAAAITEPADGTKLVVEEFDGDWRIFIRDDSAAAAWVGVEHHERWFDAYDREAGPASLHHRLTHARGVYPLGEQLAVFA